MAWNPPADFAVNEVLTSTKMDQIRESLLYLKGQGGEIVPEDVIAPVRNDGNSSYTMERSSATARKYGLLIGALGDFGIQDLTAAARRLTISSNGTVTIANAIIGSSTIFSSGQALFNGFAASSIAGLGVAQANCYKIWVAAENITGSTITLFTGVTVGASGNVSAFGSGATGWANVNNANRAIASGTGALASFSAGEFIVELTAGGVIQARRVSGSQTWAVTCEIHLR